MQELVRQALMILRATWRYRRLGMFAAWIVGAIFAGVILRIPDRYEASARIYVDTQSILRPLMSGLAVQPNIDQQVMMLSRTLISRPNVEKLIRMADLDLEIKGKAAQEELITSVMSSLKIQGIGRDNLYTLSFIDTNPVKAQRVVQAFVSIFIDSSLGDKTRDSDSARKFIDEQIRNYEKKLQEAEERLRDFKLKNIELQVGEGKSTVDRVADISNELSRSRLALREAENSRDALRRQIAGEDPLQIPSGAVGEAGAFTMEIDGRIDAQKRNLDALLQKYTEQHPDVLGTRRLIKELEEQRRKELVERKKFAAENPGASVSNNPVYQRLRMSLGDAEANVASLRARVAEYEKRFERTTDLLRNQPQIEAEFAQLNRDYDITKRNYEQLVSRRESAELTGDLDAAGSVADFRLIDPPRASNNPVAPNRLLLLPMGLIVALAAGLGIAFLMSQIRPVFFDSHSLRETTGLPVVGTVTLVPNEARRQKERASLRRFVFATAGLVCAYGIGIAALAFLANRAV